MSSSSTFNTNPMLGPKSTYNEVHGNQNNITFVFSQIQIIRDRLSSIDTLPPGAREELTDISHCLADVVFSVMQQSLSDQLKQEIRSQIQTAVALNRQLNIREESASEAGDQLSDRESIISATRSVYSLGAFSHFFEDPNADTNLASSLEELFNGPLALPRYPYPTGPGAESTYSFHSHPPLAPTGLVTVYTSNAHHDMHQSINTLEDRSFELPTQLEDVNPKL